jgi:hypothetical protein
MKSVDRIENISETNIEVSRYGRPYRQGASTYSQMSKRCRNQPATPAYSFVHIIGVALLFRCCHPSEGCEYPMQVCDGSQGTRYERG